MDLYFKCYDFLDGYDLGGVLNNQEVQTATGAFFCWDDLNVLCGNAWVWADFIRKR